VRAITRENKNFALRSKFSKIYNYWEPGIGVLTNNLYQYSNTHPLVPNLNVFYVEAQQTDFMVNLFSVA